MWIYTLPFTYMSFGYVVINKFLCDLSLCILLTNDYFVYSLAKNFRYPYYVTISMGRHTSLVLLHNCFECWWVEILNLPESSQNTLSTHYLPRKLHNKIFHEVRVTSAFLDYSPDAQSGHNSHQNHNCKNIKSYILSHIR
jgi:hypothetical protein